MKIVFVGLICSLLLFVVGFSLSMCHEPTPEQEVEAISQGEGEGEPAQPAPMSIDCKACPDIFLPICYFQDMKLSVIPKGIYCTDEDPKPKFRVFMPGLYKSVECRCER